MVSGFCTAPKSFSNSANDWTLLAMVRICESVSNIYLRINSGWTQGYRNKQNISISRFVLTLIWNNDRIREKEWNNFCWAFCLLKPSESIDTAELKFLVGYLMWEIVFWATFVRMLSTSSYWPWQRSPISTMSAWVWVWRCSTTARNSWISSCITSVVDLE